MKKYLLIAALLYGCYFRSTSQVVSSAVTDSLSLYKAMKTVKLLKDSAKVDLLNSIAARTTYILSHETRLAIGYKYATEALQEATRLNYKTGIARALLTLSATSFYSSMNMPGDATVKQGYFNRAFHIAQEISNYELLGWCYYGMAGMPVYTKNSSETIVALYQKAIENFLKAKDTLFAAEATLDLSDTYGGMGDTEHAFEYAKKGLELSKKSGEDFSLGWKQFNVQFALQAITGLYSTVGDYETAMNYILENARYGKDNKTGWENFDGDIAGLYCTMGKYDSATVYASRLPMDPPPGLFPLRAAIFGQIYLNGTKEYDKAIAAFIRVNDTLIRYVPDTIYATAGNLINIGQAYDGKRDFKTALEYAAKGILLLKEKNNRPEMMRGYQVLSTIYHHLGNNDSAYEFLMKYNTIKDSIQNKRFLLRIYNSKKDAEDEKKQAQLSLLDKDNKLKTEQLKQESQQKNFLLILISVLVFTGVFIYRSIYLKRKNERLRLLNALTVQNLESDKKHAELKQQAIELEMQALRAQMNPHFIFNCLSSINRFIFKNETKAASDYLTRFSRLIRMVLMHSQKKLIPLEDELEMLRLYLDMERLRFKNAFDYTISTTNAVESTSIFIPPLLLQPFCENAIWHGLMHKEGQGHLNISISEENKILHCIITDDGVGREMASVLRSKSAEKEKSLGLQITTKRLALLNGENSSDTFYEIEDVLNENDEVAGTKVSLKIRYKESVEEIV